MSNVYPLFGGEYAEPAEDELEKWLSLVPALREQDKHLNISLGEIEAGLEAKAGKFEFADEVWVDAGDASGYYIVRCNLVVRQQTPRRWRTALKLGKKRIDGIDYEDLYDAADGSRRSGWHRHLWVPSERSADPFKEPVEIHARTPGQFITEVLSIMKVTLSGKEVGHELLR